MKLSDVTDQLKILLPKYTNLFSSQVSFSSVVASSNVVTIDAVGHGLSSGEAATLQGFKYPTPIDSVSQDGLIFTFTTSEEHDLTYGWQDEVELAGFTDAAWNDSFALIDVTNRNTFKVQSTNTLPILNGSEVLYEDRVDGVNGIYTLTAVTPDQLSVTGSGIKDGTYIGGQVHSRVQVAGSVSFERALEQYTEQSLTGVWAFVVMDNAETSKDRNTISDAVATPVTGSDIRLRLVDGFVIHLFKNVSAEIAAEASVDILRHDLLFPILRSVFGARFDTGLSGGGDFRTILKGHNMVYYNRATLVYSYAFEVSMDLIEDDAVQPQDTRAYRDTNYTHTFEDSDTVDMTVTIKNDEET